MGVGTICPRKVTHIPSSGALSLGHRPWKYDYKPLIPSSLSLEKSLPVLGENEVNTQTYADPKGEKQGEEEKDLIPGGPVMPDDGLDTPVTRIIKFPFYLS